MAKVERMTSERRKWADQWYLPEAMKDKTLGARLTAKMAAIRANEASRLDEMNRYTNIYEWNYRSGWGKSGTKHRTIREDALAFNHAQSIVNAMALEVATADILVMFYPQRAAVLRQQVAELAQDIADSLLRALDFQEIKQEVVYDYAIRSIGLVLVDRHWRDGLRVERLLPMDTLYDRGETRYRKPRNVYHDVYMDRYEALEIFGGKSDEGETPSSLYGTVGDRVRAITNAPTAKPPDEDMLNSDQIRMVEAWHLPMGKASRENPRGGMYVLTLGDVVLEVRPYWRSNLPVYPYTPLKSAMGMYGIPAMRQLAAGQREHEKTTQRLQRSHQKLGQPMILVSEANTITPEKLGNDAGLMIRGTDISAATGIRELTLSPAPQEAYSYREGLRQEMHQVSNAQEFIAQGEIPRGIRDVTGKAMETMRQSHKAARVDWYLAAEKLTERCARGLFDTIEDMIADGRDLKSVEEMIDRAEFEEVQWKELFAGINRRFMGTFAVPGLSMEPGQRFSELSALREGGAISTGIFLRLWRMPTFAPELDILTSTGSVVDVMVLNILTTGKMQIIEPADDLVPLIARVVQWVNFLRATSKFNGVPQARIDLVYKFLVQATARQKQKQMEAGPKPMGQEAPAPGPGPAPPGAAGPGPAPMPPGPPPAPEGAPPMPMPGAS